MFVWFCAQISVEWFPTEAAATHAARAEVDAQTSHLLLRVHDDELRALAASDPPAAPNERVDDVRALLAALRSERARNAALEAELDELTNELDEAVRELVGLRGDVRWYENFYIN